MKVLSKRGRVVVSDGHLGLLRENGELQKSMVFALVPTLLLIVGADKYRLMLSYERSIHSGLGDGEAKAAQCEDNDRLSGVVRRRSPVCCSETRRTSS